MSFSMSLSWPSVTVEFVAKPTSTHWRNPSGWLLALSISPNALVIEREVSASTVIPGKTDCKPLLEASITESPNATICCPLGMVCTGFLGVGGCFLSKSRCMPCCSFSILAFSSNARSTLVCFGALSTTYPDIKHVLNTTTIVIQHLAASHMPFSGRGRIMVMNPPRATGCSTNFRDMAVQHAVRASVISSIHPRCRAPHWGNIALVNNHKGQCHR